MNRTYRLKIALSGLVVLALVFSCQSVPDEIPEGLSQAEMFQRAQEASDAGQWDTALNYYRTFIERFPDAVGPHAEARYEVAFITYKRGDPEQAVDLFQALIDDYEQDSTGIPDWPIVLARTLVEKIQSEARPARSAVPQAGSPADSEG